MVCPGEKDREVLVKFDCITREFNKLKDEYKVVIKDITKWMGNGMVDYIGRADDNANGVKTVEDYELYYHCVAGLLGEGLIRLFIEAKLADPASSRHSLLQTNAKALFLDPHLTAKTVKSAQEAKDIQQAGNNKDEASNNTGQSELVQAGSRSSRKQIRI